VSTVWFAAASGGRTALILAERWYCARAFAMKRWGISSFEDIGVCEAEKRVTSGSNPEEYETRWVGHDAGHIPTRRMQWRQRQRLMSNKWSDWEDL
jgi:hypothetical protein